MLCLCKGCDGCCVFCLYCVCYANNDVEMEPLASVKLNTLISATYDEIRDVITSC